MRSFVRALILAGSGLAVAGQAPAQVAGAGGIPITFAVEGRASYVSPFGLWNINNDTENGLGGGANLQAWIGRFLGLYAGFEANKFKVERADLEQGVDSYAMDRGFRVGLMTPYPLIGSGYGTLVLYGGGIFNKTSYIVHNNREMAGINSNADLGYEAGSGLHIPFAGGRYMVTPGVRYRTHKAVFGPPGEGGPNETDVEYLVVDLGIRVNLSR